jgi:hypothetical protein
MARIGGVAMVGYRIRGDRTYHERFLLAHVRAQQWVIMTPDFDIYIEDFGDAVTFRDVKYRPCYGTLPMGLPADAEFYIFDPAPSVALIRRWIIEGDAAGEAERGRLGLGPRDPADVPALAPELVGPPGALVPAGAGAAAPLVGGGLVAGAPPAADRPAAAAGAALPAGLAALAAALQGGGAAAGQSAAAAADQGDARTLPVRYEESGVQYREFREAVMMSREARIDHFVVQGPRTTKWVLAFMLENGGTPLGRHGKFKADTGLSSSDPGIVTHEHLCKILQTAVTVDQLDVTNSASMELVCREIQMIEEKYADKLKTKDPLHEDGDYFMRMSMGQSNVCMCPALREWIGEQMKVDSSILKERRKAREERQLQRAPPEPHGKGAGKKNKD